MKKKFRSLKFVDRQLFVLEESVKLQSTKGCLVAEKEVVWCLEVTGNCSEGHVALTDESSQQDSSDVCLSVTSPVVPPVDVDKDR